MTLPAPGTGREELLSRCLCSLPHSLLSHRGQALQVQLLRPELQTAKYPGGTQGEVPQLPAESQH